MPKEHRDWNQNYADGDTPWDSGQRSRELERVLKERNIAPCRVLELGCGTGTNAVFLAQRGFEVTAFDLSHFAIEQAKERAVSAGVKVDFIKADIEELPELGRPFPFVFDRGVYHVLRRNRLETLLDVLRRVTESGSHWLTLAGNANDDRPLDDGPPVVTAEEICRELEPTFTLVQLREFRFDGVEIEGQRVDPLAWSVLLRRR